MDRFNLFSRVREQLTSNLNNNNNTTTADNGTAIPQISIIPDSSDLQAQRSTSNNPAPEMMERPRTGLGASPSSGFRSRFRPPVFPSLLSHHHNHHNGPTTPTGPVGAGSMAHLWPQPRPTSSHYASEFDETGGGVLPGTEVDYYTGSSSSSSDSEDEYEDDIVESPKSPDFRIASPVLPGIRIDLPNLARTWSNENRRAESAGIDQVSVSRPGTARTISEGNGTVEGGCVVIREPPAALQAEHVARRTRTHRSGAASGPREEIHRERRRRRRERNEGEGEGRSRSCSVWDRSHQHRHHRDRQHRSRRERRDETPEERERRRRRRRERREGEGSERSEHSERRHRDQEHRHRHRHHRHHSHQDRDRGGSERSSEGSSGRSSASRRTQSHPERFLFCIPWIRSARIRAQILRVFVSGLCLSTVTAVFLALMLTHNIHSREVVILLVLFILFVAIVFSHSVIRLCVLLLKRRKVEEGAMREQYQNGLSTSPYAEVIIPPGGYAVPREPIPVVLARDEEAAGIESEETKLGPPAYGQWRNSVRVDPNRLFWARVPNAPATEASNSGRNSPRPPSYSSEDGVSYVVEARPRSIAPPSSTTGSATNRAPSPPSPFPGAFGMRGARPGWD